MDHALIMCLLERAGSFRTEDEDLDGDEALKLFVSSAVDRSHAAEADSFYDCVAAEFVAGYEDLTAVRMKPDGAK